MEDYNNNQIPEEEEVQKQEEQIPKFRGLYRYVNISVKQLDMIIGLCILVIIIVVAIELMDPGFTVSFNSLGGTDVAPQEQMYGDLIENQFRPPEKAILLPVGIEIAHVLFHGMWKKIPLKRIQHFIPVGKKSNK